MSRNTRLAVALAVSVTSLLAIWFVLFRESPSSELEVEETQGQPAALAEVEDPLDESPRSAQVVDQPVREREPEETVASEAVDPIPIKGRWLVTGRVVREARGASSNLLEPVEGARVHFKAHPRRTRSEDSVPPQSRLTGADGRFGFGGIPGNLWLRLEVDVPSFAYRTLSFQLSVPEAKGRVQLGDILLEPARTLRMDVVGPRGGPVENAEVLVGRKKTHRAETLANASFHESRRLAKELGGGRYVLERAPVGLLRIQVLASGYARIREYVDVADDELVVIGLEEGLHIAGLVRTVDGKPLPDAVLEVDGPNVGDPLPTARTDTSGRFVFDILSEGEYSIKVSAEGYASLSEGNITAGVESIEFVLTPEAVFAGRVVARDSESDQGGVANARVALRDTATGETWGSETDVRGLFEVRGLAAGRYLVVVDHEGFAPALDLEFAVSEGERVTDQTIRLRRGFAISGSVLEAETRKPVPFAWVTCELADATAGVRILRTGETGTDGRCELEGLVEGTYVLNVTAAGHFLGAPQSVTVSSQGKPQFTVLLDRGGSISGRVIDTSGNPLAGATLDLRPVPSSTSLSPPSPPPEGEEMRFVRISHRGALATQITDAEGRYRFSGLPRDSRYSLSVSHWKYAPALLTSVAASSDVKVTLERGATVRGRVVDPEGIGIPSAKVKAILELDRTARARQVTGPLSAALRTETHSVRTDSEGRYAISGLRSGTYTVTAKLIDRLPGRVTNIEVAEDAILEEVKVVLEWGEFLAGRVVDTDGKPVAGARIRIYDENSTETRTDLNGRFLLSGLPRAKVSVSVFKSGFVMANVVVIPPDQTVLIILNRSATIRGAVVESRSGTPVAGARILLRTTSSSAQTAVTTSRVDGTFLLQGIPEGQYQLVATHGQYAEALVPGVSVFAGKTRELLVELSARR